MTFLRWALVGLAFAWSLPKTATAGSPLRRTWWAAWGERLLALPLAALGCAIIILAAVAVLVGFGLQVAGGALSQTGTKGLDDIRALVARYTGETPPSDVAKPPTPQ